MYRRKALPVEAIYYDGTNGDAVRAFIGQRQGKGTPLQIFGMIEVNVSLWIIRGNWVVRDVNGKCYMCSKKVFKELFEDAE